ncbi:MAG: DUF885 domain-containing protein, partial [Hellea sp.]|nr:DUF885 domain-containing protein [Hellea sp.]
MPISRRTLMQSSAALAATGAVAACKPGDAVKSAPDLADYTTDLLNDAVDLILNSYPESASSAGLDTGDRKHLKSKLTDRSQAGQDKIAGDVRALVKRLQKVDTSGLDADAALNVDVVKTIFETTAYGFDFPYGDIAQVNYNWSYRNSPYAVAQNTGAFTEIPSFLDSSHKIETAEDADAYLMRMNAYADQLDGETERTKDFGGQGVILPDFLLTKTLGQLKGALAKDPTTWGIVTGLAGKTENMAMDYGADAAVLAREKLVPAMQRQVAVLEDQAARATSDAGVWAKPRGDEYYDWNIRASTTTKMSADEIHQMGLDELAELQGRMEPILQSIGYTKGSVGARMTALAEDPRYHFADGDAGR